MKSAVAVTGSMRRACTAALAALLCAQAVLAGDEDISPNAYQQFDPVTGFMITVDPDAENQQGHPPADAGTADAAANTPPAEPPTRNRLRNWWLYVVVAAVAGALFAGWVRGKARSNRPL